MNNTGFPEFADPDGTKEIEGNFFALMNPLDDEEARKLPSFPSLQKTRVLWFNSEKRKFEITQPRAMEELAVNEKSLFW